MTKYYIAYGSNLSIDQMARRCPEATAFGTAELDGWQLLFKGPATIKRKKGRTTPVLVWTITESDEKSLDRYEGYPHYYIKRDLEVKVTPLSGGEPVTVTAMVYIMTDCRSLHAPTAGYYGVLDEGYQRFGFDREILEQALVDSVTGGAR